MNPQTFNESLSADDPPAGLSLTLQALWWDAKGDWEKAHDLAQRSDDAAGAHTHAYLHRKEGDQSNASYWYRRAGVKSSVLTLDAERDELIQTLLTSN